MDEKPKYWFPAKKYGYGWGFPVRWQGWAVLVVYFALVGIATWQFDIQQNPVRFALELAALSAVLMFVCYLKGERPRWRWGERR